MTGNRPFILFVCSGNTCRSPMAEALIRHRLGASAVGAGSAGLAALEGCRASAMAREVMLEIGVDISAHRSRAFRPELAGKCAAVVQNGVRRGGLDRGLDLLQLNARRRLERGHEPDSVRLRGRALAHGPLERRALEARQVQGPRRRGKALVER